MRAVLLLTLATAASCKTRERSEPVRVSPSPSSTAADRKMPGSPSGECLQWSDGICTARAYTPAEAIALHSATSIRHRGSELDTSCTLARDGICTEAIFTESECRDGHGTFRRGPAARCPTETSLGTCRWSDGAASIIDLENGRGLDALDAREDCTGSQIPGTWTDGPKFADATKRRPPHPSRIAGSCFRTDGTCRDYSVEDTSVSKAQCAGRWASSPCPTAQLAGTCRWADGMTERFYKPNTKQSAKLAAQRRKQWIEACESTSPVTANLGRFGRGIWLDAN